MLTRVFIWAALRIPHPEVLAKRASKDATLPMLRRKRCVLRGSGSAFAPQHEESCGCPSSRPNYSFDLADLLHRRDQPGAVGVDETGEVRRVLVGRRAAGV